MRLLVSISLMFLSMPKMFAQAADPIVIRGWVLDEQKQSVHGVVIQLLSANKTIAAAITGNDGKFKITLDKQKTGAASLTEVILYPGYLKQTIALNKNDRERYQDIILQPDPNSEFESAPMQPPPLVDSFEAVRATITGNGK